MRRKLDISPIACGLIASLLLAGCGGAEPAEPPPPEPQAAPLGTATGEAGGAGGGVDAGATAAVNGSLTETEWRLVEFQSMDDAIGTLRPNPSQAYTMRLSRDGTVTLRLNCNRGTGTWSARPSEDGTSGSFEFGPLATTRALCPPPSLDERLAADTAYVRGYLLSDGRLYLSLMADGGIYAWEPVAKACEGGSGVAFDTTPDAELEEAIRRVSPDYTRDFIAAGGSQGRYLHGCFDLDGDGTDEVFAYLLGPVFCGTGGCDLLLFVDGDQGYTLINDFPISRLPVLVSDERTGGWSDLFRLESGGGAPPTYVRHAYDGVRYVERERLPVEPAPAGTEVLTGGSAFQDGIPLKPQG